MSDVDKPSWWRSATPPLNWPTSGGKWHGRVTLPEHLRGQARSSTFDFDDSRRTARRVRIVLREGFEDDVRT